MTATAAAASLPCQRIESSLIMTHARLPDFSVPATPTANKLLRCLPRSRRASSRLRCQHPLCRFNVDERISIELCRDDIRPLIEDLMKCVVIRNVENRDRASPHASIDLPAYT